MIAKLLKVAWKCLRNPLQVRKRIIRKMPNIIHIGNRTIVSKVRVRGRKCIKKTFENTEVGLACFKQEILADELFRDKPWKPPIMKRGNPWFIMPYFQDKNRLDKILMDMDEKNREELATQAIKILFDIFMAGYAHKDFHENNIFLIDQKLKVVDFEFMEPYPEGKRPPFPLSYDITGEGLESPQLTNHMCYKWNVQPGKGLQNVLKVTAESALEAFSKDLKYKLQQACSTFVTGNKRHVCKAGRIYSSFTLPYIYVKPEEAQRNSEIRLNKFGIGKEIIQGKTVLDIGSNIGGMIFSIQKYGPKACLGIDIDADKTIIAKEIAAFNGLNNFKFIQADIDFIDVNSINGPFDVVFCLAIEAHVKNPKKLFKLLSQITSGLLYFEGNASTDQEYLKRSLFDEGFHDVSYIGISNDDCIPENNCRPLFIARKTP